MFRRLFTRNTPEEQEQPTQKTAKRNTSRFSWRRNKTAAPAADEIHSDSEHPYGLPNAQYPESAMPTPASAPTSPRVPSAYRDRHAMAALEDAKKREELKEREFIKERELAALRGAAFGGLSRVTSDPPRDSIRTAAAAIPEAPRTDAEETGKSAGDVPLEGEVGGSGGGVTGVKADTSGTGENPSKEETADTTAQKANDAVDTATSQTDAVRKDDVLPRIRASARLRLTVKPALEIPAAKCREIYDKILDTLDLEGVIPVVEHNYPGEDLNTMLEEHITALSKVRGVDVGNGTIVESPDFTEPDVVPFHILAVPCLLIGSKNLECLGVKAVKLDTALNTTATTWDTARKAGGKNTAVLTEAVKQHAKGALHTYNNCLWAAEKGQLPKSYLTTHRLEMIAKWVTELQTTIMVKRREADFQVRLELLNSLSKPVEHDTRFAEMDSA